MGLCVVFVLSVMILCCGLVSLCLCVYDLVLCGSLCGCPCPPLCAACLVCCAVIGAYSIDSGDGKPGRLKLSGGGVPPEGDGKPPQEPQGVA